MSKEKAEKYLLQAGADNSYYRALCDARLKGITCETMSAFAHVESISARIEELEKIKEDIMEASAGYRWILEIINNRIKELKDENNTI